MSKINTIFSRSTSRRGYVHKGRQKIVTQVRNIRATGADYGKKGCVKTQNRWRKLRK